MINVPILLTLSRIMLIPFLLNALIQSNGAYACILLFIAALTDTLDGMWARYFRQETLLGKVLDPLADKLLLISCYTVLLFHPRNNYITTWFFVLALVREICIIMGTGVLYFVKNNLHIVKPTIWGKLAMCGQIIFLIINCLGFEYSASTALYYISPLCMIIVSILMIISWIHYTYQGIKLWHLS